MPRQSIPRWVPPHPPISIQALFMVVVPFDINLPSWKSASSTLLCSHGAPRGIWSS